MHSTQTTHGKSAFQRLAPVSLAVACASTLSLATAAPQAGSWGLDALDQVNPPLDNVYLPPGNGNGVDIYVISTGIETNHMEFDYGLRASFGADFSASPGAGGDCNGLGTYLASLAGGSTYGPAKAANLIDVRVLDCLGSGSTSTIIGGIDWVVNDHPDGKPAVALLGWECFDSASVFSAIDQLIADDIVVVMSAGPETPCSCLASLPEEVIVTGAVKPTFCPATTLCSSEVDVWAGAFDMTGAWPTSPTSTNTIDDYSGAAALAAGVAANFMGLTGIVEPATVRCSILAAATPGWCSGPKLPSLRDTTVPVSCPVIPPINPNQHTVDFEDQSEFGPANIIRYDQGVTVTTFAANSNIRFSPSFGSKVVAETKFPGTPNNPAFAGSSKNQMIRIYFDVLQDSVTLKVGYVDGLADEVQVRPFSDSGGFSGVQPYFVGTGPKTVTVNKQAGGPWMPEIKIRGIEITPVIPAGVTDIKDRIAVDDITFHRCRYDINGDGIVDLDDALRVYGLFKVNQDWALNIYYEPFDVDDNGVVDLQDALDVYNNPGGC